MPKPSVKAIAEKLGIKPNFENAFNPTLYDLKPTEEDTKKQENILTLYEADPSVAKKEVLEILTPNDLRYLIKLEDEMAIAEKFERLFPTKDSVKYLEYFPKQRYYTILAIAWEEKYSKNRTDGRDLLNKLCLEKVHLK